MQSLRRRVVQKEQIVILQHRYLDQYIMAACREQWSGLIVREIGRQVLMRIALSGES